ncbi:MAG: SCP2 sterol-binding domain-containing protein [Candidatus Heimdallarchaeota archaeon]|nr:MAG: hypothetical protein DRP02_10955 [Candidatus Gerdarchaeota archaeon]RLI73878.1 MAG: hypothetical protein DRO91_01930 [Candidatus Heimdallarchaeota archaeon]
MVTDEEIVSEMDKFRAKMTDEKYARHFKNWNKTMQYFFNDTGDYWHIVVTNGQPGKPAKGKVDKPDINYEMSTTDFLDLMQGRISGLKLYNQKRLKIKASMPDILKLQKLA